MNIPANVFKSYDIRGIYPDEVNENNIYVITQSILNFFQKEFDQINIKIVVGHDMRLSAPKLYPIVLKALVEGGAEVYDFDLLSTPTFYFAVSHTNIPCGFILSASHNPPNYTGFKIITCKGNKLLKIGKITGLNTIKNDAIKGIKIRNPGGRVIKKDSIVNLEVDNALKEIDINAIKPMKIVIDATNAMSSLYLTELFSRLPCKIVKMNFDLDGTFPAHDPNPLIEKNLVDIKKKVIEEKADLGIAPDGDGDRLIFIDEKGQTISASLIGSLIARKLLKKFPGETIMFNVTEIITPKTIASEEGGKFVVTPVGHTFVTYYMHEHNALFAGEISGHYFFRSTGGAESGVLVIANLLELISKSNQPVSLLIQDIRRSYASGEHNFSTDKSKEIMDFLKVDYSNGDFLTIDGIAVDFPTWRFSVRSSNTEPLLRLNVESKTKEEMEQKLSELIEKIQTFGAELYDD